MSPPKFSNFWNSYRHPLSSLLPTKEKRPSHINIGVNLIISFAMIINFNRIYSTVLELSIANKRIFINMSLAHEFYCWVSREFKNNVIFRILFALRNNEVIMFYFYRYYSINFYKFDNIIFLILVEIIIAKFIIHKENIDISIFFPYDENLLYWNMKV